MNGHELSKYLKEFNKKVVDIIHHMCYPKKVDGKQQTSIKQYRIYIEP